VLASQLLLLLSQPVGSNKLPPEPMAALASKLEPAAVPNVV